MPRYAIVLEYDGTDYAGFQTQANTTTVQSELERCAATILRTNITLHVSGRTDSGVHATGQTASFEIPESIPDLNRFAYAMNSLVGPGIQLLHVTPVPDDFHARFSCLARAYEYLIWNDSVPTPHLRGRALWFRTPLLVEEMDAEMQGMLGERDWKSFTRHEYREEPTKRYVDQLSLKRREEPLTGRAGLVCLRIRGNAFLHNMIRILAGTILDRALGKVMMPLPDILESRHRLCAGQTAPPHGLYLRQTFYPPMSGVAGLPTLIDYPLFGNRARASR